MMFLSVGEDLCCLLEYVSDQERLFQGVTRLPVDNHHLPATGCKETTGR